MSMSKVFVTGGSGFLGKEIIRLLKEKGFSVRALARSSRAGDAVSRVGAEPFTGGLDDVSVLEKGIAGCDWVFHSAAVMKFRGAQEESREVNVLGTARLLEAAKKAGAARFVLVSAAAVLSRGGSLLGLDETAPMPEKPYGAYAQTKAEAEKLVLKASGPEMAALAVRPPFIWGAGDEVVLPRMVEMVKKGRFAWVDQGRFPYSTCHVKNVCEGALLAAEKGRGGECYFLTDGPPLEFRDFITRLLQARGVEPPDRSISRRTARLMAFLLEAAWSLPGFQNEPPLTRAELALLSPMVFFDQKARKELGYQGLMSLENGLLELESSGQADA